MKETPSNCLTEGHLLLFGAIIQWFAQYELLMQKIMAAVAGCDSAAVMLMTRDLDFGSKYRALLRLLRHRTVPLNQYDRIYDYLTVPYTLMPLRDDIAHSTWIESKISASIQPNWILQIPPHIEPVRNEPDASPENFIERNPNESAHSLDNLAGIVQNLASNHRRFADYLLEIGLIGGSQKPTQHRLRSSTSD